MIPEHFFHYIFSTQLMSLNWGFWSYGNAFWHAQAWQFIQRLREELCYVEHYLVEMTVFSVSMESLSSQENYTPWKIHASFISSPYTVLLTFFEVKLSLFVFCHFVWDRTFSPNMASSALLCFWTVTCNCQYLRYTHMRLPFFLLSMFSRSAQCLSLLKISFRSDSRSSSAPTGFLTTLSSMFFSISSRCSLGWMREQYAFWRSTSWPSSSFRVAVARLYQLFSRSRARCRTAPAAPDFTSLCFSSSKASRSWYRSWEFGLCRKGYTLEEKDAQKPEILPAVTVSALPSAAGSVRPGPACSLWPSVSPSPAQAPV